MFLLRGRDGPGKDRHQLRSVRERLGERIHRSRLDEFFDGGLADDARIDPFAEVE